MGLDTRPARVAARAHLETFAYWADPDDPFPWTSAAANYLRDLAAIREAVDELILEAMECRAANDLTWQDVALALGVSRQAAQQRYGRTSSTRPTDS
jgi:hypothetical protein